MKGTESRELRTDDQQKRRAETRDKRQEQGNVPSPVSESEVGGPWPVVVIGYGNDLRGDDAIGPLAAAGVAAWKLPGVQALAVRQLAPELAEALAASELAIFVDACASPDREEIEAHLIHPAALDRVLGHTGDPRELLALTETLYGRCPAAWLLTVPARSFAFGAALSPVAERGLAAVLEQLRDLIQSGAYQL